jgi:hypothetical protein
MCCGHIAGYHFEEYEKECNTVKPKIQLNFHCIPKEVMAKRDKTRDKQQGTLGFAVVNTPKEFTRAAILEMVAKHIVCADQVSLCASRENVLMKCYPPGRP